MYNVGKLFSFLVEFFISQDDSDFGDRRPVANLPYFRWQLSSDMHILQKNITYMLIIQEIP